ncbi:hypothetical protein HLB03_09175 [Acidianus sp. DSM 29099]|nr:hypothetical protein [Acidianus sp. RZ1]
MDSLYVVLAHGDNISLLRKVYEMKRVIGTTQVRPFGKLKLYGGFTDGDRSVILAKLFQASKILLYSMDFDSNMIGRFSKPYFTSNIPISWIKAQKLKIAKQIVDEVFQQDL